MIDRSVCINPIRAYLCIIEFIIQVPYITKYKTVILFGHFKALYGSHSQSKNGLYFPNFMYFSTYFPNFSKYFPKCEGKGSFLKSQIKSL